MAFLEFKNVEFSYPSGDDGFVRALDGVSFSVERGEFVALVGCNGSGKSTLARLCNGLITPDAGEVTVDGDSTEDKTKLYDIRKKIGVVFQNPDNQMVTTIVEDDVAFGPENLGLPPDRIRTRVDNALRAVGMEEYAKSGPLRLSGGQKQRVAIAGVLALDPELLILDEATGMLDPDGRREVLDVVKSLNRDGRAVIMITHFMEEAAAADRIIILDKGRVAADGGRELFSSSEVFDKAGLDVPLPVRLSSGLKTAGIDIGAPLDRADFVAAALDYAHSHGTAEDNAARDENKAEAEKSERAGNVGATAIKAEGLSYVYSPKTPFTKQALNDVDLNIEQGDFLGIIGSTGAGKSTLVSHFNALIRVQKKSGKLNVFDMDLAAKRVDLVKLRAKVGMVFQYPEHQLFDDTVEKDVRFGPKNLGLSDAEQAERARDAIVRVGLDYDEVRSRSPFELSGGQKRRVALAGVLAMRPSVLVLDEPTAGLDPRGKRAVMDLIASVRDVCPTVVMISHNMDEIAEYCNKIAVMKNGRVMGVFTPRELFGNRKTLDECGVRLPLVTELAAELFDAGLNVSPAALTERELFDGLVSALDAGRRDSRA